MPHYRDFDPLECVWGLGRFSLVAPVGNSDFLYRVDGTEIGNLFEVDMTHKLLSQHPISYLKNRFSLYFETVMTGSAPIVAVDRLCIENRALQIENLVVPFSNGGNSTTEILLSLSWELEPSSFTL